MNKLSAVMAALLIAGTAAPAQSPVNEIGDEKEPELRSELVKMAVDDQNVRGEYWKFIRARGLVGLNNKAVNEKLDSDPVLKKEFMEITGRMTEGDKTRAARLKEIVTTKGWPGRTLVGTEAAGAAWLIVSHAVFDLPFQRRSLDLMKRLGICEVENSHLAYLTDRVLLAEGKKQVYGTMPTRNENGNLVPQPIEDEANLDKRRAEIGLQPFAEYIRRLNKRLAVKK